jgi:hypothetical protein
MQALGLVWRDVDPVSPDSREVRVRISAPVHFGARLLHRNWRARTGGFVEGRDVPSRALAPVLRNLAVYEPVEADFRVRLAGTALVRRYGCDITGLLLSQLYESAAFACQRKALMRAMDGPTFHDVKITRAGQVDLHYELLQLPLLSPDRAQRRVLGGFFYHDWAR